MKTVVTVPSARSLEPVDLPLDLSVDEVFMTREQWSSMEEERDEEILVLDTDTIDLTDSIEDNILLAIPMQVFSEEELRTTDLPKGNDWEVVSEEDYLQKKKRSLKQLILVLRNYLSCSTNQKMTSKIGIKCITNDTSFYKEV